MASATHAHEIPRESRTHGEPAAPHTSRARLRARSHEARLRRTLGWLSVGLGTLEIFAANGLSRWMGARRPGVVRMLGVRELAIGMGLLAQRKPAPWVWARIAGDVMDLGLLGALYARQPRSSARAHVAGAAAAVAGIAALDVVSTRSLARGAAASVRRVRPRSRSRLTVNREPAELYHAFRSFENLPRFTKHVIAVEPLDDARWRWRVAGPRGTQLEWAAELLHEQPGRSLAWRTLSGTQVELLGHVRFDPAPGKRGTLVTLDVEYLRPPRGLGARLARLVGKAAAIPIHEELRRFKRWMEAGEVPTTEGQPSGRARRAHAREERS